MGDANAPQAQQQLPAFQQQAQQQAQQQVMQQLQVQQQAAQAAAMPAAAHVPYNTSQISKPSLQLFHGRPEEDVILWVKQFERLARRSTWNDQEAIEFAEQCMREKAQVHFAKLQDMPGGIATFDELRASLTARFAESTTALWAPLEHRVHQKREPVRDYIEDMRSPFDKLAFPAHLQTMTFIKKLNDSFKDRVTNRAPRTMDEAEAEALYFDDLDIGQHPDRAYAVAKKRTDRSSDDSVIALGREMKKGMSELVTGLTDGMQKLTLSITGQNRRPDPRQQDRGQIVCFNCGETGHKSPACPKPKRHQRPATQNVAMQNSAAYGYDAPLQYGYEPLQCVWRTAANLCTAYVP